MSQMAAEYYERVLGMYPPPMSTLGNSAPEFIEGYIAMRESVIAESPDGLSPAMKELVLIVLDVAHDNKTGAINHLGAAMKAGLTKQQVLEAMLLALVVGGISCWSKTGYHVYAAAAELEQSSAAD